MHNEKVVAVPINFGMLSYTAYENGMENYGVAVPINFGMLSYNQNEKLVMDNGRSPHQFWNALLPPQNVFSFNKKIVAVPINFGMLSYIKSKFLGKF